MKTILLLIILTGSVSLQSIAQKQFTRSGHISFFSSAPLENIEAHNYQVNSVIDFTTGNLVFSLLMKGFEFEKALMQEHFNEKYVHSDKYPKAIFKGAISDFENVIWNEDGEYLVAVSGDLTIHGVTKTISTEGKIVVKEGNVSAKAVFPIILEEYDIKIPSVVKDNIAKTVEVTVEMSYEAME